MKNNNLDWLWEIEYIYIHVWLFHDTISKKKKAGSY